MTKHIFHEFKTIVIIFVVTFIGMLLFTNAQVFFNIDNNSTLGIDRNESNIQTDNSITISTENKEKTRQELEILLTEYDGSDYVQKQTTDTLQESLQGKMKDYSFEFDMVPPTNRIVIGKINMDVPIVDSKYKNEQDFSNGDFSEELQDGAVKYPKTAEPGQGGNTLIFGHTSQERWQKNPYGTVFSKIPNLDNGDEISIIWGGKLYKYRVVEKTVVTPKNVNTQYQKYMDGGDYITLMGCYPIGRTDKRMMITAERIY